jgi:UDP-3-O-[3-hydroxymyristoyl] glucosamine N-acyltransferase
MRAVPVLVAVLAVPLSLLAPRPALAGARCDVEIGPRDRVAKGETLVIRSGERVENAMALHGDLVVEGGAVVEKAVAVGGSVTIRSGAQVMQDAVAVGGDVDVEADGRVGHDAVSLGGQVKEAPGAKVRGSVVGLAIQGGKSSLARQILKGLGSLEECSVIEKGGTER